MPARAKYFSDDTDAATELVGLRRRPFSDAFNSFLRMRWSAALGVVIAVFLTTNLIFAALYVAVGGVDGARQGSLADAFFFSVETLGTVGYGAMHPVSTAAHVVVALEVMTGLLLAALTTGALFSKFSVPSARVLFSERMAIAPIDGVPTLMFRIGNERGGRVLDAAVRVVMTRTTHTSEGIELYRMVDLPLVRERMPAFTRAWMLMHAITPDSPLHGATAERLAQEDVEIAATLTGVESITSQPVHAGHSWIFDEVVFGARFADMLTDLPGGRSRVDFTRFDALVPER